MKKSIQLLALFFISGILFSTAQVRVGGGVSIDVGIPDIVIGNPKRAPRPVPQPRRVPQPVPRPVPVPVPQPRPVPRTVHTCNHTCNHGFGTIDNTNRPDGRLSLIHI